MKYLLTLFLFCFLGCSIVNEPKDLTYEVFSNYGHFTVTYLTYTGEQITSNVHSYEWRKTFPVDSGSPAYLKVVGDSVQAMQAKIKYDSKVIIEQIVEDTLPVIEFSLILY